MAIVRMTFEEALAYVEKNNDRLQAMYDAAPEIDDGFADFDAKPLPIARGFAAFKEYINKRGRPKTEDKQVVVSFRLPQSVAKTLRSSGRGWQTRAKEYIIKGVAAAAAAA